MKILNGHTNTRHGLLHQTVEEEHVVAVDKYEAEVKFQMAVEDLNGEGQSAPKVMPVMPVKGVVGAYVEMSIEDLFDAKVDRLVPEDIMSDDIRERVMQPPHDCSQSARNFFPVAFGGKGAALAQVQDATLVPHLCSEVVATRYAGLATNQLSDPNFHPPAAPRLSTYADYGVNMNLTPPKPPEKKFKKHKNGSNHVVGGGQPILVVSPATEGQGHPITHYIVTDTNAGETGERRRESYGERATLLLPFLHFFCPLALHPLLALLCTPFLLVLVRSLRPFFSHSFRSFARHACSA